jgi:hypothetical protein
VNSSCSGSRVGDGADEGSRAESSLRLEFDRQLAKEKEILSVKYDGEVDELHVSLESKVKGCDAEINELKALRKLDSEWYDNEIGVWHARDRKLQSGLLGLEHALHGKLASVSQLLLFYAVSSFSDGSRRSFSRFRRSCGGCARGV